MSRQAFNGGPQLDQCQSADQFFDITTEWMMQVIANVWIRM